MSKLAGLLRAVGGGPRDEQPRQTSANPARSQQSDATVKKHTASHPNGNFFPRGTTQPTQGDVPAKRGHKRRRTKPGPAQKKRSRREAGPASKASVLPIAGSAIAAAQALAEETELSAAERQKLLGGRSAYEALMDELARSVRRGGGGSGGGGSGGGGSGHARLRAQLQLLRSEQLGEVSSEDEEGDADEDDDDGEDEELEDGADGGSNGDHGEEADAGAASGTLDLAAAAANRKVLAGQAAGEEEESDGGEDEDESDGSEAEEDGDEDGKAIAIANGHVGGPGGKRRSSGGSALSGGGRARAAAGSGGSDNDDDGGGAGEGSSDGDGDGPSSSDAEDVARTSGAGRRSATADPWVRHVGRELSDAAVAALTGAGKNTFQDAPTADEVHVKAWGANARWQTRLFGHGVRPGKGGKAGDAVTPAAAAAAAAGTAVGLTELPAAPASLPEYGVKERLVARWREVRQEDEARAAAAAQQQRQPADGPAATSTSGRPADFRDLQQQSLFALLNSYADVHLPYRPYPTDASLDASDPLLDAVLLHCLNHVAKTADRINKNNHVLQQQQQQLQQQRQLQQQQQQPRSRKKARKNLQQQQQQQQAQEQSQQDGVSQPEPQPRLGQDTEQEQERQEAGSGGLMDGQREEAEANGGEANGAAPKEQRRGLAAAAAAAEEAHQPGPAATPRDQGFTRPKVLLLLPQRNFAFRAVRRLVALAIRETRSDSVQGKERFVEQFTDPEEGEQAEEDLDAAARARLAARPAEHRALFAGNLDDHFRLGIKVTKGAIRLFADMYNSDIIVASPVALATKLAEDKAADPHARPDFLSSIELLVVDRADVMGMQNWAHVETVVSALNQLPREQHGTDIMRVRDWYLSGQAAHYRQTVIMAAFATPLTNALARAAANHAGALRLAVEHSGVLGRVVPQVKQLFERFPAASPAAAGDARFEFFMRALWPRVKESVSRGLLVFVPSYFDFVRLRNALKADDSVDFATISEYSSNAEVTRCRARFFHGQRRVLLYTERAHFYHRYRIRGIKDLLFYGLPDHAEYYSELVNLLEEGGGGRGAGAHLASHHHATVTALFCSWDVLQLERVVGSGRARRMLRGESGTYVFC